MISSAADDAMAATTNARDSPGDQPAVMVSNSTAFSVLSFTGDT